MPRPELLQNGVLKPTGVSRMDGLLPLGRFHPPPLAVAQQQIGAVGAQYLTIVCFSYPAVTLTNVLATVLRNTERVKLPMYVSAVTTVVNAVVDYGLIFGAFGFPAMGVRGAALATCISAWMGPVLILLFSAIEKNLLIGPVRELLAFNLRHLGEFCRRALPVVCNEGLWAIGTLVLNMTYSNLGYVYYAGMTYHF